MKVHHSNDSLIFNGDDQNLYNGFRNNFVNTFLRSSLSKNLIKLVGLAVPVVLPELQPFQLHRQPTKFYFFQNSFQET